MKIQSRKASTVIGVAVMVSGALFSGANADAQVMTPRGVTPQDSFGCNGPICIDLLSNANVRSNSTRTWYGHQELCVPQVPSECGWNTGDTWWSTTSPDVVWAPDAIIGNYCVIAWNKNKDGSYSNIGEPCEWLSY